MLDLQVMLESFLGTLEYVDHHACKKYVSAYMIPCRESVKEECRDNVLKSVSVMNERLMKHNQVYIYIQCVIEWWGTCVYIPLNKYYACPPHIVLLMAEYSQRRRCLD